MSFRTPTLLQWEIARTANYEVAQLAPLLRAFVEENDASGELAPAVRGGLLRLSELSDIIFDAIFNDDPDNSESVLVKKIGGREVLQAVAEGGAA